MHALSDCGYADIPFARSGRSQYYYNTPTSWQFCVVYADSTTQLLGQKVIDGVPMTIAYIGVMNMLYTW